MFILLAFFFTGSYAQVIYDKAVEQQYQQSYDSLPIELKEKAKEAIADTSFRGGIVVLTNYQIDTLNKNELTMDISSSHNTKKDYYLSFCMGLIKSDTLFIELGTQFSSQSIQHVIFKNSVITNHNQFRDNESIFRADSAAKKTNDLTIPAEAIKFVLSDSSFSKDKAIYGYAEIVTKSYFQDSDGFRNGYILKQLRYKYYFEFKPTKNGT